MNRLPTNEQDIEITWLDDTKNIIRLLKYYEA